MGAILSNLEMLKSSADGANEPVTPNQAYKKAKLKGYAKSFAAFLKETKESGLLEKWFGKKDNIEEQAVPSSSTPHSGKETKILGMSKGMATIVGLSALALIVFGAYKLIKK